MWRKKYFLVLIFCIFSLLWSGCSSLNFKNHKIEKNESTIGNAKVFLESFPPQRPKWVNSVPVSEKSLFFIGVSSYLANETTARDGARNDVLNHKVLRNNHSVKGSENKELKEFQLRNHKSLYRAGRDNPKFCAAVRLGNPA